MAGWRHVVGGRLSRWRVAPAALVLLSSAVALALAEALARVVDPHVRDHVLPSGFFVIDPKLGWRQRPGHTVTHDTRDFVVTYTTNALGYRDRDRTGPEPAGRTRILMFGDSQVFGWGVPAGHRFSDLLELRHPELEVWNLGVMAYGLDQQLLDYEARAEGWQAEAVGFLVSSMTLRRTETDYYSRKHKPRFVVDSSGALRLEPVPPVVATWTTIAYRLLSPWYLPYFVERRLAVVAEKLRGSPVPAAVVGSSRHDSPSALTRLLLGRVAERASARGHQVVLLADLPQADLRTLREMCAEHGIQVIALDFPPTRAAFIFSAKDPHWTQRAHARVAELFWTQWTEQRGVATAFPETR